MRTSVHVASLACAVVLGLGGAEAGEPLRRREDRRFYGPDGKFSYRAAADILYRAKANGQRRRAGKDFAIPRLRAVEQVVAEDKLTRPFEGFQIYGLQHIVPTTESLMRLFVDAGALPGIELEGKVYSEAPLVVEEMQKSGRRVGLRPWGLHANVDPKESALLLVKKLKAQALREPHRKFLVIDDGADLIEALNDALEHDPALAKRIVGVQQTRHGTDRLRGTRLRFPVVDVGDCFAKREYEGPSIGRSVALRIDKRLRDRHRQHQAIFLMGYGAVGRHTALVLKRLGYKVRTYDPDPKRALLALQDGVLVTPSLEAGLATHDVVVGATGKVVVTNENWHHIRDDAMLFNAASNATEFDQFALMLNHFVENQGAPINFGSLSPVPARYIQLTRGLLYLAAKQAIGLTTPGLHVLDEAPQRKLVTAYVDDLAKSGESPLDPRFELDEL